MLRILMLIGYWLALIMTVVLVLLPWGDAHYRELVMSGVRRMWGIPIIIFAVLGFILSLAGPSEWLYDSTRHGIRTRLVMGAFGLAIVLDVFISRHYYPFLRPPYGGRATQNGVYAVLIAGALAMVLGFLIDWAGAIAEEEDEVEVVEDVPVLSVPPQTAAAMAMPTIGGVLPPLGASTLVPPAAAQTTMSNTLVPPAAHAAALPPDIVSPVDPASLTSLSYAEFAAKRALHVSKAQEEEIVALVHQRLQQLRDELGSGLLSAMQYQVRIEALKAAILSPPHAMAAARPAKKAPVERVNPWQRIRSFIKPRRQVIAREL